MKDQYIAQKCNNNKFLKEKRTSVGVISQLMYLAQLIDRSIMQSLPCSSFYR